ncbi:hypothetical protein QBC41DRAFT_67913 [Cercophora samala]|uniref:Uncharacterized protein n=1 Tax=Cercophora samala TaxID=330535 RepID=A0AA39ZGR2_9PEZI|nr:hypothetical protein QBC41DRAFT_67913 [Cercophora samala]
MVLSPCSLLFQYPLLGLPTSPTVSVCQMDDQHQTPIPLRTLTQQGQFSPSQQPSSRYQAVVDILNDSRIHQEQPLPAVDGERSITSYFRRFEDFVLSEIQKSRKHSRTANTIIQLMLAIAVLALTALTVYLTEEGASLSRWTAKKEFLDYCEAHEWESFDCQKARNAPLEAPPGVFGYFGLYELSYTTSGATTSKLLMIASLTATYLAYFLCFAFAVWWLGILFIRSYHDPVGLLFFFSFCGLRHICRRYYTLSAGTTLACCFGGSLLLSFGCLGGAFPVRTAWGFLGRVVCRCLLFLLVVILYGEVFEWQLFRT